MIFSPARRAAALCLKVKHNAVRGKKGKVVDLRQPHMALASKHPSMICHLQYLGPALGGFGFGAACFRDMLNSIPDCICTDTAVASSSTIVLF
jgi:hypothetical protein